MKTMITITALNGFDLRYVTRVALGDDYSEDYHGCLITAAMADPGGNYQIKALGESIGTLRVEYKNETEEA
jgi:hypothetical protein